MSGLEYDYYFDVPDYMQQVPHGKCMSCDKEWDLFEMNGVWLCVNCLCETIKPKGE